MKLIVAATPAVAIPTIELLKKKHDVSLVTQPDAPAGRGKQLRPTPIGEHYQNVAKPETEEQLSEMLKGSDLLITIGYGRILKSETLNIPKFGGINLHFSLLPKWRGAAPVQRAIESGDKVSGVSVFQMDSGMDTGPIWIQEEFKIPFGYSSEELFEALAPIGAKAIDMALIKILNEEKPLPQSGAVSIAHKISKSECRIDWRQSDLEIIRKVRAFGGNPGITANIRGESLKINSIRSSNNSLSVGELNSKGEVGTATNAVQLLNVTPAGKRPMDVKDWLNGFKIQPGEKFE